METHTQQQGWTNRKTGGQTHSVDVEVCQEGERLFKLVKSPHLEVVRMDLVNDVVCACVQVPHSDRRL